MIHDSAGWIISNPDTSPGWNQYIEAFLIHARKVTDLLDPENDPWGDDVTTADFLGDQHTYPIDLGPGVRAQIDKRLAHITHAPVPDNREVMAWPIPMMLTKIEAAMNGFIAGLRQAEHGQLADRLAEHRQPRFRKETSPAAPDTPVGSEGDTDLIPLVRYSLTLRRPDQSVTLDAVYRHPIITWSGETLHVFRGPDGDVVVADGDVEAVERL